MKTSRTLAGAALAGLLIAGGASLAASGADGQNGRARGRTAPTPPTQAQVAAMDRDGDGVVTRAEWTGRDAAFRQADTNADGVLSGTEVRPVSQPPVPVAVSDQARLDELNARFSRLDADNDGGLSRREWTAAAAAFDRADADQDGVVTRTEYIKAARAQTPRSTPAGVYADPRENTTAYRAGYDRGLIEGRQAGKEDRAAPAGTWDLEGQRELEQADSGYEPRLGPREDYQAGYRIAFKLGYSQGFGPR